MTFLQTDKDRVINIRKLVARYIMLHGPRLTLIELGIATGGLISLGSWFLSMFIEFALGLYIFLVGTNCLVLLVYAMIIASLGSATAEVPPDLASDDHFARKYDAQQLLILVPFAVLIITVIQEITRLS